jgi:sulfatase maturation enzyme AslB (radical SAM superfamily)
MFNKINRLAIKLYSGCNMNCDYCFQSFNEKYSPKEFKEYDLLYEFLKSLPLGDHIIVTFCGGEMTLRPDLIEKCEKKVFKKLEREFDVTFTYSMISNGTNPNVMLEMFDKKLLDPENCHISWDGLYSISKSRKCPQFSDESMKRNIKHIGESIYGNKVSIVHALTPTTINHLAESFQYCLDNNLTSFGYYPIHEAFYDDDFHIVFREQLEKLYQMVLECYRKHIDINFFNLELVKLENQPERFFTCKKLGENLYINALGEVYPCIYFGDNHLYRFGSIKDGLDETVMKAFMNDYLHYPKCDYKNCKCTMCGECPAACAVHNGNMNIKFQNLCKIRQIEKEVYDKHKDELSHYIAFTERYTTEDLQKDGFNHKFTECDLDIIEHEIKQPHFEYLRNWHLNS